MPAVLRFLLLCVLALVLPLKGVAAVTMAGCGMAHQRAGQEHAAHHHDAGAHHAAHAAADAAASADAAGGDDGTGTHAHPFGAEPLKCSACAPCCGAAAPADAPFVLPDLPPSSALAAQPAPIIHGVDAEVPHRPPRLLA